MINPASRISVVKEYYFSRKLKEIAQLKADGLDIINLGIGSPDLPPPSKAIEVLNQTAQDLRNHGYQSYVGLMELRQAYANWYQKFYQVQLNPQTEILPLMGSKEGIMHISMTFLEKGDQVLVPNPGYPAYRSAGLLAGATVVEYKLSEENNWLPDIKNIEQQDLSKAKIMWINYPHMPTGRASAASCFKDLLAFAKRHEILLCHDNPYSFTLNENPMSILHLAEAKAYVLELNSLSKSHNMSGWRLGMLAGHPEYIQAVLKFKSNMDSGMFKALQLGAIEALSCGQEWYDQQNEIYRKRRKKAYEILDHLGCAYSKDGVGMFVWAKIPKGFKDGFEFSDHILAKNHAFITPGGIFGSQGNAYIRISLCSPVEVLEKVMARLLIPTI